MKFAHIAEMLLKLQMLAANIIHSIADIVEMYAKNTDSHTQCFKQRNNGKR